MQLAAPRRSTSRASPPRSQALRAGPRQVVVRQADQPPRGDRRLRPEVPGRPPAARTRASGSCRSGAATTTASPAATGTRTRTSHRDHGPLALGMARGTAALIQDLKRWACSTTRSSSGRPSSAGCPRARAARAATTTLTASRTGWPVAASRGESRTVPATSSATSRSTARTRPRSTISTPPILHLLGIDHTRLTVRHDGIDRRLTDVHGHVIHEILV